MSYARDYGNLRKQLILDIAEKTILEWGDGYDGDFINITETNFPYYGGEKPVNYIFKLNKKFKYELLKFKKQIRISLVENPSGKKEWDVKTKLQTFNNTGLAHDYYGNEIDEYKNVINEQELRKKAYTEIEKLKKEILKW
jgi:hypothetical protein